MYHSEGDLVYDSTNDYRVVSSAVVLLSEFRPSFGRILSEFWKVALAENKFLFRCANSQELVVESRSSCLVGPEL